MVHCYGDYHTYWVVKIEPKQKPAKIYFAGQKFKRSIYSESTKALAGDAWALDGRSYSLFRLWPVLARRCYWRVQESYFGPVVPVGRRNLLATPTQWDSPFHGSRATPKVYLRASQQRALDTLWPFRPLWPLHFQSRPYRTA